ncbi:2-aminoethylphosphonate ABC transporter permease protein II (TC 3.A.1.9.1) [Klebsiella pneumoniae IS46]|nr:2-aminoethylphosphonate ABC transporter permease protein II (TC 3.A.1.9.1) [Klebsiella pneumoniae IS46]
MNGTFFIVLAAHFVLISAFTFSNVTTGLARISADIEKTSPPAWALRRGIACAM